MSKYDIPIPTSDYKPLRPRNVRPSKKPLKYPDMPIAKYKNAIYKNVMKYNVIAIDAPTGSGKTRYLPYLFASKGMKVRVAIPTIVGVESAYHFQKKYTNLEVGMATSNNVSFSPHDKLVYATTGYFAKSFRNLGDILFIDEIHDSTTQVTMLLGLIQHYKIKTKIVFTSATFNRNDVLKFFSDFPIIKIPKKSYPIEEIYIKDKSYTPLYDNANTHISKFLSREDGNGIIFRPGIKEVDNTIKFLSSEYPNILFLPAHSSLSEFELDKIFQESEYQKVVVGTSIIESSVTVKDVSFVIDDMLEKIPETGSGGEERLALSVISKDKSEQRRGRTGRTMPGRNYKIITKEEYDNLDMFRKREIDRVPISKTVLEVLGMDLNPVDILKIDKKKYRESLKILKDFGLVKDKITEAGRYVSKLPLSIENGYMVYLCQYLSKPKILRTTVGVACLIENYRNGYWKDVIKSPDESNSTHEANVKKFYEQYIKPLEGENTIHTLTNIYNDWAFTITKMEHYDRMARDKYSDYTKQYCNLRGFNYKKFKAFLKTYKNVAQKLSIKDPKSIGTPKEMQDLFLKSHRDEFIRKGNSYIKNDIKYKSDLTAPRIIGTNIIELSTDKGVVRLIGIAVPFNGVRNYKTSRVENRLNNFKSLWKHRDISPKLYVDFGSGEGSIGKAIGEYLNVKTRLMDTESAKDVEKIGDIIPLDDNSVGLLTAFMVIHHSGLQVVNEFARVLDGYLYIREHDVVKLGEAHYINWVHFFDMVRRKKFEELNVTYYSKKDLNNYLEQNFELIDTYEPSVANPQKIYEALYKITQPGKSKKIVGFSPTLEESFEAYRNTLLKDRIKNLAIRKYKIKMPNEIPSPKELWNSLI